MSLLQVWFWVTIAAATYVGWQLWKAPLIPDDHRHVDEFHEKTVKVVDDT